MFGRVAGAGSLLCPLRVQGSLVPNSSLRAAESSMKTWRVSNLESKAHSATACLEAQTPMRQTPCPHHR